MKTEKKLAPHETFEIHELLTFKNVCATKAATMTALASDDGLKTLLRQDLSIAQNHIRELQGLLQQSDLFEGASRTAPSGKESSPTH